MKEQNVPSLYFGQYVAWLHTREALISPWAFLPVIRIDNIICLVYIIWIGASYPRSLVCATVFSCAHSSSWEFSDFKHLYNKTFDYGNHFLLTPDVKEHLSQLLTLWGLSISFFLCDLNHSPQLEFIVHISLQSSSWQSFSNKNLYPFWRVFFDFFIACSTI